MKTSDFDYDLPESLIAQHPTEKRDEARLMVLDKETGEITHRIFRDVKDFLRPGDVLVINDSKVIPARIYGKKIREDLSEGADCEFLLLRQRALDLWETIVRPGKRLKEGARVRFGNGLLEAVIREVTEDGNRIVQFEYDKTSGKNLYSILDEIGRMPLPPYITEELKNNSDYQTVYAREEGSAAAPTAGLHFTEELLNEIRALGVEIAPVMLHVGLGTFRPVKADSITDHVMHSEFFTVTEESAEKINRARKNGGRIIAVGTTSCRTLESASTDDGIVHAMCDDTGIFIYPGYQFKAVDALITNFHLPQSTLIMLVSAFSNREIVMNAYETAVKEKYRFFSFGDAMFIH
ncbi:MAG: tRNA preQ1(34) S-adenosylmethionine ribosyltransferase-isomerase QueA [Clostridia bacterium]|nr:tRNA preQ1(34) S-adenosylmethionine ribosyltransferase-isomerase QueA [Clostridia bacterium]MBR6744013.1 tRNA preQ1(34) S-adenosylmethionine ribosyltransferase-isomerase QueA [Clostridia bacterium]